MAIESNGNELCGQNIGQSIVQHVATETFPHWWNGRADLENEKGRAAIAVRGVCLLAATAIDSIKLQRVSEMLNSRTQLAPPAARHFQVATIL